MKGLVLSLGATVGLLGFSAQAPAQHHHHGHHHGHHHHGHHHHGHHHHHGFYPSYGWGGYRPYYYPRTSFSIGYAYPAWGYGYARPWGGYPGYGYGGFGYPGYGVRYGGFGYPGYGYQPGFSFGLTVIR